MSKTGSIAKRANVISSLFPFVVDEFRGPFDDLFREFASSFMNDYGFDGFGLIKPLENKRTYPKVEVYREGNDLVFNAAVPGMKKDQLSVEIDDGVLSIKGESINKQEEDKTKNGRVSYISELKKSSFVRRFVLPDYVPKDYGDGDIKASLQDGILEIRLVGVCEAKQAEKAVRTITIE